MTGRERRRRGMSDALTDLERRKGRGMSAQVDEWWEGCGEVAEGKVRFFFPCTLCKAPERCKEILREGKCAKVKVLPSRGNKAAWMRGEATTHTEWKEVEG